MSNSESSKNKLSLPPLVSFEKRELQGAVAYVFRHEKLGELGRILVQGIKERATYFTLEVVGDPADPMTAKRKAIVEPLSLELMERFQKALGPRPSPGLVAVPQRPPEEKLLVQSKLIQCERCVEFVALLVFADDATTQGRLEDYARLMYPQYMKLKVPTWIIGAPLGAGPLEKRPAKTLQVWPHRETSSTTLGPSEFDRKNLDPLRGTHCR